MNVVEKIKYYTEMWQLLIPHIAAPEPKDISFWTGFEVAVVEAAIMQASNKFAQDDFDDASEMYRYVTGTCKGMTRRGHAASPTPTLKRPAGRPKQPVIGYVAQLEEAKRKGTYK